MVIYSGFIVDLPIENDDLMGFYWDTLWLWPIVRHGIDGPNRKFDGLPSYKMGGSFHGELWMS